MGGVVFLHTKPHFLNLAEIFICHKMPMNRTDLTVAPIIVATDQSNPKRYFATVNVVVSRCKMQMLRKVWLEMRDKSFVGNVR